jgi:DNA-binding beta-propeller fold protein YncE
MGLTIDPSHQNLYVADTSNSVIRKVVIATGQVSTIAGAARDQAYADGPGDQARFYTPWAFTIDSKGENLYVADTGNDAIRTVSLANNQVSTVAGTVRGSSNGIGTAAGFNGPKSITIDPTDTKLYVADGNDTIRLVDIASRQVTTLPTKLRLGAHSCVGGPHPAYFLQPFGIVNDGKFLYVADSGSNSMVRKISMTNGYTTTIAGEPMMAHDDGSGTDAHFNAPMGIALGGSHLYIADAYNHDIRVVDLANNKVTTLAGSFEQTGATDGIGTAATFDLPSGVAIDRAGQTLYVANRGNHEIRKVDIASGQVTTFAGSTTSGFSDGVGTAATFSTPADIVMDPLGVTLYVADSGNNAESE